MDSSKNRWVSVSPNGVTSVKVFHLPLWALHVLMKLWDLGLWVGRLYFYMFLYLPYGYAQSGARIVVLYTQSMAHLVLTGCIYMFLQGTVWVTQLGANLVNLQIYTSLAILKSLTYFLKVILLKHFIEWLALAVMKASKLSVCILSQVWPILIFTGVCVRTVLVGLSLSLHVCFASVSSKVLVKVHAPFFFSLPLRLYAPMNLKINLRPWGKSQGRDRKELNSSQGESLWEQRSQISQNPLPMRKRTPSSFWRVSISVVPSAATLIIVVCVGFLALMVVLGLVRIHSLHQRVSGVGGSPVASDDPKDPDLFWDDSALTIIVNPMESYQSRQACVAGAVGGQQEDEDSSDSEAADSPSHEERRIIESAAHRY